jgi:hypothetical protein
MRHIGQVLHTGKDIVMLLHHFVRVVIANSGRLGYIICYFPLLTAAPEIRALAALMAPSTLRDLLLLGGARGEASLTQ